MGRAPAARLEVGDELVHRVGDGQVQDLAVQGRVIGGGRAGPENLTIAELELPGPLHRVNDLGCLHIDDVQGHLGVRDLLLSPAEETEELGVTHLLAPELGHRSRHGDLGPSGINVLHEAYIQVLAGGNTELLPTSILD